MAQRLAARLTLVGRTASLGWPRGQLALISGKILICSNRTKTQLEIGFFLMKSSLGTVQTFGNHF
jgi:hypothetical protein